MLLNITSTDYYASGSNFDVYKIVNNSKKLLILKILRNKTENTGIINDIISETRRIHLKLDSLNIFHPKLYFIGQGNLLKVNDNSLSTLLKSKFIIIESYCGKSLKEIYHNSKNRTYTLSKVCGFINKLPETIPLDCNPRNITYKNKFYLIDFMPPDPWLYNKNSTKFKEYIKLFPSLKYNSNEKKLRYYENYHRIARFKYYLGQKSLVL